MTRRTSRKPVRKNSRKLVRRNSRRLAPVRRNPRQPVDLESVMREEEALNTAYATAYAADETAFARQPHTTKYAVAWDNGAHGSGRFSGTFDTYEEADAYGRNWAAEMNSVDQIGVSEDGYSYEVVEVPAGSAGSGEAQDWDERTLRAWRP